MYLRHRHLKIIDCLSLFTVPATSAAQNSLLFFFFLLRLLTELISKQGRPWAIYFTPSISMYLRPKLWSCWLVYCCHRNVLKLMGRHTFIFDIDYRGYHIMILVYFTVGSTSSGSAFVIAPKLGAKTIFESISRWRWLLPPHISWSGFPIRSALLLYYLKTSLWHE